MSTAPKTMRDFCEITSSKRIFASEYVNDGIPFYRSKEIIEKHSGKFDVSTERPTPPAAAKYQKVT